jgi:hypothetical protein
MKRFVHLIANSNMGSSLYEVAALPRFNAISSSVRLNKTEPLNDRLMPECSLLNHGFLVFTVQKTL